MKTFISLLAIAFCLSAGAQTKEQQLTSEVAAFQKQVCADAKYKPKCDQLDAEWVSLAETSKKFGRESAEVKAAKSKIESDNNALEDALYADSKYGEAYKHIQLLYEQLGLPHHGRSK